MKTIAAHSLAPIEMAQNAAASLKWNPFLCERICFSRAKRKNAKKLRDRLMRIERREAVAAVLSVLFANTTIRNRSVQYPLRAVAEKTGLCSRRIDRVIHDLQKAGAMYVVKRGGEWLPDGTYKARACVRQFTEAFLELLGVSRVWRDFAINRKRPANERMRAAGEQWESDRAAHKAKTAAARALQYLTDKFRSPTKPKDGEDNY